MKFCIYRNNSVYIPAGTQRWINVETTLNLGWDVDQHWFNVDSTLAIQRWNPNVDSTLNRCCVELPMLKQRWSQQQKKIVKIILLFSLVPCTYIHWHISVDEKYINTRNIPAGKRRHDDVFFSLNFGRDVILPNIDLKRTSFPDVIKTSGKRRFIHVFFMVWSRLEHKYDVSSVT